MDSTSYLRPFTPQPSRAAALSDARLVARRAPAASCERNGVRGGYAPVSWSAAQEVLADFHREARTTPAADAPASTPSLKGRSSVASQERPSAWQGAPVVRYQPATSAQSARWASVVTAVVVLIMGCATGAIMLADGQRLPVKDENQGAGALPFSPDQPTQPSAVSPAPLRTGRHHEAASRRKAASRKRPAADITTPLPPITMIGPGLSRRTPATAPVAVVPGALAAPDSYSVLHLLSRYFGAINTQNYAVYERLFSAAIRSSLSETDFFTTYGSTQNTQATLQHVRWVNRYVLAAEVSYISHQLPEASPTGATCNRWDVTLYMSREDGRLVIVSLPSDNSVTANCVLG